MKPNQKTVRRFLGIYWSPVFVLLAFLGCDRSDYSSAEGAVKLEGEPLANATVLFPAPQLAMATARTDEAGRYRIKTGGTEGMRPGEYTVTVAAYGTNSDGQTAPILIIPENYLRTESSGLKASIMPGVNRDIDFELNSEEETSFEPIAEQRVRAIEVAD